MQWDWYFKTIFYLSLDLADAFIVSLGSGQNGPEEPVAELKRKIENE